MVFSSTLFLFVFLPFTLLGYYLMKETYRNYWLLFVSILFFAWSQPQYLWIILLNIAVNYVSALLLEKMTVYRRVFLAACILENLGILYYFKYFDFTIEMLNVIFRGSLTLQNIILPIGISFFTFQGMSYVIDVYRRQVSAQKNPFKVALYVVLFPQLIAGPIVRYKDIAAEIDRRSTSLDDFSSGVERFIIGLAKKAILANTLAAMVDSIWGRIGGLTCLIAWIGSIAYTLQIYYDFSGYSDMAIGLGRMFGFHFNENFNLPYVSASITEFWRRWHISLSSWFRDYVYIPLGGNRKRVYLNLAIVFLLTGIWHGASVHFIAWGIWNGCFILIERAVKNREKKAALPTEPSQRKWKKTLSKLYTLAVVNTGWVIFRAPHMKEAAKYVAVMFGLHHSPVSLGLSVFWYLDRWTILIVAVSILFATSLPVKAKTRMKKRISSHWIPVMKYAVLLVLLLISMLRIVSGTYNPFIYFQF